MRESQAERPRLDGRLDHLDSLRGIAALCVVACHFVIAFGLPGFPWLWTRTPLHICWDGPAAVSFFFVLSGMVLSLRHFRATSAPNLDGFHYAGYAIARVCRIWLPYLAILGLSVVAFRFSATGWKTDPAVTPLFAEIWRTDPTFRSLIRQAFDIRLAVPLDGTHQLVPQAWSLTVEVVMSLLLPLAVVVAGRSTAWLLMGAFLATHLARVNGYVLHFAVGVALAKHFRDLVRWLESRPALRVILALCGWFFAAFNSLEWHVEPLQSLNLGLDLQALGSAILIAVASSSPGVRAWLSRGLIHHIGKISFSLYLIHMIVLICVTPRLMHAMSGVAPMFVWWIGLGFTVVVSLLLSDPLYRVIETPTAALGKRLSELSGSVRLGRVIPLADCGNVATIAR
jgi:peptidoglycan/LPS O-acetylase OafA/YrhL